MQRVDAVAKVTGTALYAADLVSAEGTDVAIAVTAARGRCRIDVDATAAMRLPGVRAIVTPRNAPRLHRATALGGSELSTLLPLQDDLVVYAGQCVALVVAETLLRAQVAAAAVQLRYLEEGTDLAVVDLEQAEARLPKTKRAESVERREEIGRATGDVVVDQVYGTAPAHHNALELGAVIAAWDESGRLTIKAPIQWTEMAALTLAQVFGMGIGDTLPGTLARVMGFSSHQRRVQIVPTYAGGSFGRNNSELFLVLAALAAKANRRPVALQLSRRDTFTLMPYRGETRSRILLMARADGSLVDLQAKLDATMGAAGSFVEPLGKGMASLYDCPNVHIEHHVARLDLNATGWMRAPGLAPGMFALESAMDELAVALNIDPVEVRIRNYADTDPQTGRKWSSKSLKDCYTAGAAAIGWGERRAGVREYPDGRRIGYGMAGAFHPNNQFPGSARVTLLPDGSAEVDTAIAEIGQGSLTAIAALAAEALGLPTGAVSVRWNDPSHPPGAPTFGSGGTLSNGSAVTHAARKVRRAFLEAVRVDRLSPHHGQRDIVIRDGLLVSAGGTESVVDAIKRRAGRPISCKATRGRAAFFRRRPSAAFGAVFTRVAFDPVTGEVRVEKMVGAYACGRVVNPPVLRGQLAGGMLWGLGQALLEQTHPDPRSGNWINRDLAEALVPTHADAPEIEVILVEEDDSANDPTGIKGGGEIGLVGAAAAIANAIFDASGVRVRNLPVRLDALLTPLSDNIDIGGS